MKSDSAWNSIIFTVPPAAATRIRGWQQVVNLRLIAAQIAKEGRAFVTRLGKNHGATISELPALGQAEPYVGDFGGLYTFVFSPTSDSCELEVRAAVGAFVMAGIDTIPPLEITLSKEVASLTTSVPPYEQEWSDPRLNRDEDTAFVHEVSLDELEFLIDGTMYERLVAWGWDPLQIEAYRYVFVPLSVGCELLVEHRPSEQKVHLTQDVGW